MAGYRGIGVVFARRTARSAGVEATLKERLPATIRETFIRANMSGWVPIEHATEIFDTLAPLVYTKSDNPIRELGRALARDNLGGPYKHFVRMMSVSFLMTQTALVWRAYHNAGKPEVDRIDNNTIVLRVNDYGYLPERFSECMCGWIEQAITMTGGKDVFLAKSEKGGAYIWRMTWT